MPLPCSLLATAGLATALLPQAQDPTFDMQVALPPHVQGAMPAPPQTVPTDPEVRVSVEFKNADMVDVLDYLKNRGFNYVIPDKQVSDSHPLTVSVANQPLTDLADAIATTMNGHWLSPKGVHVFVSDGDSSLIQQGSASSPTQLSVSTLQNPFAYSYAKVWGPPQVLPSKGSQYRLIVPQNHSKVFIENGRFWTWELKQLPEFKMRADAERNLLEKLYARSPSMLKQFREFVGPPLPAVPPFVPQTLRQPEAIRQVPEISVLQPHGTVFETLTKQQEQLLSEHGYLRWPELSARQQALLGHPQGEFSMEYRVGNRVLKIKNE